LVSIIYVNAYIHLQKEIHDNDESKYVKGAETLIELFRNNKSKEAVEIIQGLPKHKLAKANFNFF
jgi:hypothetical protein